ncbi:hypothetical protein [Enterobacter cloacae complex sp. 418I7]|uniref:hypothetical protein n=1 Tax=Enterobacter cloacae complex sp. 418I7 TaxID=3395839 RepID=UPI003CECF37D
MEEMIQRVLLALHKDRIENITQITNKNKVIFKYIDPHSIDSITLIISESFSVLSDVFGNEDFQDFESALTVFLNQIKVSEQINVDNILII